ncbi:YkgJ family cysteine cluster protein [Nafulsella turpanensis]|uniref:YkgJ family cysteine cluster protein n=1 Tax=Nafulsella turpanensis TaxID=1265690 RepID=UPI000477A48A|nr:YkgJ family cysteine cluster protein [Nafulsella turpanensis]
MSIARKVRAVEKVYHQLEQEITKFKEQAPLKCLAGCGTCCQKADIEATVLEFLPLAYHYLLEGRATEVLEKLQQESGPTCSLLKLAISGGSSGLCSEYAYRGLICRLFGYAASRDKWGQLQLVTCNKIKEGQAALYAEVQERMKAGLEVPVMGRYYSRLSAIDPELSRKFFPINEAMERALEIVLHYFAYRPKPRRKLRMAG